MPKVDRSRASILRATAFAAMVFGIFICALIILMVVAALFAFGGPD